MSKKYIGLDREIVSKVGGETNINEVYHCQTRLRFKLDDESKADTAIMLHPSWERWVRLENR